MTFHQIRRQQGIRAPAGWTADSDKIYFNPFKIVQLKDQKVSPVHPMPCQQEVTATQKTILKAFAMDVRTLKARAQAIGAALN